MRPRRPRTRLPVGVAVWLLAACVVWQAACATPGPPQRGGQSVGGALLQETLTDSHALKHEVSSLRVPVAALSRINASRRPTHRGVGASSGLGGDHQVQGLRGREQEPLDKHKLAGDGNAEVTLVGVDKTASTNPAGTMPKFDLTSELELALVNQLKLNATNNNQFLKNNFKLSTKSSNQREKSEAFRHVSFAPRSLNFDIQNLTDQIPQQKLFPPPYKAQPPPMSATPNPFHSVPNVTNDHRRLTDKAFNPFHSDPNVTNDHRRLTDKAFNPFHSVPNVTNDHRRLTDKAFNPFHSVPNVTNDHRRLTDKAINPFHSVPNVTNDHRRLTDKAFNPFHSVPNVTNDHRRLTDKAFNPFHSVPNVTNDHRRLTDKAFNPFHSVPNVTNDHRRLTDKAFNPFHSVPNVTNDHRRLTDKAFNPFHSVPNITNDHRRLTDKAFNPFHSVPNVTNDHRRLTDKAFNPFHSVPNVTNDHRRLTDKAFLTPASRGLFDGTAINNLPYRRLNSSLVALIPPAIPIAFPSSNDQILSSSEMVPSLISFFSAVPGVSGETVKESDSELDDGISLHVHRNEVKINNISDDTIRISIASVIEDMMDNRENSNDVPDKNKADLISMKSYSEVIATSTSKCVENNAKCDTDAAVNVPTEANITNLEALTLDELSEVFGILNTIDWHDVKEKLLHGYSQLEHEAFNLTVRDLQHEHQTVNLTVHDLQHEHKAANLTVHDMKHEHETVNLTVHDFSINITDSDELPNINFIGVDCDESDDSMAFNPSPYDTDQTVDSKTEQATDVITNFIVQASDIPGPGAPRNRAGPAPRRKCSDVHGRRRGHPSPILTRSLHLVPRDVRRSGDALEGFRRSLLGVLFSFNDNLLPVPIMRSTPPKNDLLTHLISATNPIPYAMESYMGVRNMFNQKMDPVMRFYENMNIPIRPALRNLMPAFNDDTRPRPQVLSFQQRPTPQSINTPLPLEPTVAPHNINDAQSSFLAPVNFEQFPPNAIVSKTLESEITKPIVTQLENLDIIHTTVTSTLAPVTISTTVGPSDRIINIKIPTSTGKNPIFEINLMADGNIGILPVSDTSLKKEVPTIYLQGMFNSAGAMNTSQHQAPDVSEAPAKNLNSLSSMQQDDPQHLSRLLSALPPVPRREVAHPTHFMLPFHPVPPPVDFSFIRHNSFSRNDVTSPGNVLSTNNLHASASTNSRLNNGKLLSSTFGQRTNANYEPTSKSYNGITTHSSFGTFVPINKKKVLDSPQIRYQTDPFLFGIPGLQNNFNRLNAPYSTSLPSTRTPSSQSTLRSFPLSVTTENITKSSFGSDPNVYYIDITIPESNAVAPIVEHGKGGHLRTKRDAGETEPTSNRTGVDDHMTRIIQYTGWHPVDLSNPLNNEPTVSYKPPPFQKVHFGEDPPATKPLYPIVPENPSVYVVRKDRAEPEIDEVYGTEKFEYLHIEPKSKTIRAFQPAGNPRIIKFVKRLDSVRPSEQSKRSHNDPNDYFLPPVNGPNFDISNLNFNISDYPNSSPDLDMSFTENKPSVSHPFLRILPPGSFGGNFPNVANARGILPTTITPQQILQARLNLARLPLMSPLHGLFGSFTQIPFRTLSKSAGVGDSVVREVPPPALSTADYMEQQASEPVRTVLFARSKQNIDRSDSVDYFNDEDELDRISFVPSKTRFGQSRYKPKKPSKTIAANSLSELLQIFKYTNATEPPPLPTTTPPPVTIMKGFRYTKPTEPPPTTTTTRPTTTKRFRLPTAFRYSVTNQPQSYIQNTLTTTENPAIASRITIVPTLTPKASKKVTGIPDLIFDRVAETNSLDGYLFSDSEASPEFRKAEVKPNVVQKTNENAITPLAVPKALSSKRVSIRLIGANKTNDEIVHAKNSQPLKSEFEIIYTTLGKTTSFKPETEFDSPFTITQGHSKVSVFRPNNTLRVSTSTPSPLRTFSNVRLSPVPHSSSETHPSTSDYPAAPQQISTSHSSGTGTSPAESSSPSTGSERFAYYDPNYDSYDYFPDATNARATHDYPELANYDEPSYLVRRPWLQSEEPSSNPTQVSLTRLPPPELAAFGSESGDHFLKPLPHAPPPPPLHFLEGLRRAMPTSAVPTTWQDFYPGTPEESATKEPSSPEVSAPNEFISIGEESDAIRVVTGVAKSLIDVKDSTAAIAIESGDDVNHDSPDSATASSTDESSQQEADRMSPSDRIAEEVKAAIIESIVTEPFETKRESNKDETEGQSN